MTLIPAVQRSAVVPERWVCASCTLRSREGPRASFSTRSSREKAKYIRAVGQHVKANDWRSFSTTPRIRSTRNREPRLPDGPARTRFAPSPTGYLHIGGLRTALFSHLLAKRTGGQFLLRIEDTDQRRLVPGAEAKLLSDLRWAGLEWDEGPEVGGPHGPYRQSERTHIYQEFSQQLLENGSAYRCFCSPQSAGGAQMAYVTSGCYQNCASLSRDESQERARDGRETLTIRLHIPHDAHKRVYPDLVYGKIQRLKRSPAAPMSEDGESGIRSADTILLKSDGTPTYHFANVVDDHLMQITHVIRGVEWSASTPLHYDIYSAFDWTPPQFAHVGLLVDQNQAKLSKRNQDLALDVASMRDSQGVLPETLVNFLALLGWSNPTRNDVMDMQALVDNFDLKFTRGNAMVRMEKLWFLQRRHAAERCTSAMREASAAPIELLVSAIEHEVRTKYQETLPPWLLRGDPASKTHNLKGYIQSILLGDASNYENAAQWVHRNRYFFAFDRSQIPAERAFYDSKQTIRPAGLAHCARDIAGELEKATSGAELSKRTPSFAELQENVARVTQLMREQRGRSVGEREELAKPLMPFLREKLAMGSPGPSIDMVMALLGPEECARRLKLALERDGVRKD